MKFSTLACFGLAVLAGAVLGVAFIDWKAYSTVTSPGA